MSHVTPAESRGDILRRTLKELDVSHSELARRLATDKSKAANKRRQVTGWVRQGADFSDLTADRLTKALELQDERFKAVARRRRRTRIEQQVAAIAALVVPLAREQGLEIPDVLLEDDELDP